MLTIETQTDKRFEQLIRLSNTNQPKPQNPNLKNRQKNSKNDELVADSLTIRQKIPKNDEDDEANDSLTVLKTIFTRNH